MVITTKLEHIGSFKDQTDSTIKSVYESETGIIETTLLINKSNRDTDVYIVPTHNYCNLSCKICHLTKEGYQKPMDRVTPDQLIESLTKTAYDPEGNRRTNNQNGWLSFMGVGEPLLNLPLIKETFQREDELKEQMGYKDLTYALATMMPNKNLEGLANFANENDLPLKVHFSMHSPYTKERLGLLPKTRISIEESLDLLSNYRETIWDNKSIQENLKKFHPQHPDPVEIHYTLIENQNDSQRHLEKTKELLEEYKIPFKILTFNEAGGMKRSKHETHWIETLKKAVPEIQVRLYDPPGHNVGSSCGEFTKHYYLEEFETPKEKEEFLEWKKIHEIEIV